MSMITQWLAMTSTLGRYVYMHATPTTPYATHHPIPALFFALIILSSNSVWPAARHAMSACRRASCEKYT